MSHPHHTIPTFITGRKEPFYYRIGCGAVKEDFSLSLVIESHFFSLLALNLFRVPTELKYLALSLMAIWCMIYTNAGRTSQVTFSSNFILYRIKVWDLSWSSLCFCWNEYLVFAYACFLCGKCNLVKCQCVFYLCFISWHGQVYLVLSQHCYCLCVILWAWHHFVFFRNTITQDVTDTSTKSCRVPWSTR